VLGILTLVLAVFAVAACGGSGDSSGPPEIAEGRTICDECGMIIDEIRFASSYRSIDGGELHFDDIGDMLAHGHREGELGDAEIWVYDFESRDPIVAEDATFVLSGEVATPMAWGVVAFASADDAHELADDVDGTVVGWSALVERSADDDLDPGQLHEDHESEHMTSNEGEAS
jgi:copper chaperone NosL